MGRCTLKSDTRIEGAEKYNTALLTAIIENTANQFQSSRPLLLQHQSARQKRPSSHHGARWLETTKRTTKTNPTISVNSSSCSTQETSTAVASEAKDDGPSLLDLLRNAIICIVPDPGFTLFYNTIGATTKKTDNSGFSTLRRMAHMVGSWMVAGVASRGASANTEAEGGGENHNTTNQEDSLRR